MIGSNDLGKAKSFYDAVLGALGIPPGRVDHHRVFYRTATGVFSVSKPIDGKPATAANGGTIGFVANSPQVRPGDEVNHAARRANHCLIEIPVQPDLQKNCAFAVGQIKSSTVAVLLR